MEKFTHEERCEIEVYVCQVRKEVSENPVVQAAIQAMNQDIHRTHRRLRLMRAMRRSKVWSLSFLSKFHLI